MTFALPLFPPKQLTFIVDVFAIVSEGGFVIFTVTGLLLNEQPLLSDIV